MKKIRLINPAKGMRFLPSVLQRKIEDISDDLFSKFEKAIFRQFNWICT